MVFTEQQEVNNTPIFVQGLWRTGSTYIWRKFREDNGLMCFAKPFHHSLEKHAVKLLGDFERAAIHFGFQDIATPYYAEYGSDHQGVPNFDWQYSVHDYALAPPDEHPGIQNYIQGLLDQATRSNKRPFLKFNRGLLRGQWLQEKFDATSFYVVRSPERMLNSYQRVAKGKTSYYMPCYMGVLGENGGHPLLEEAANHLGIPESSANKWSKHFLFYARAARNLTDQQQQDVLGYFWALGIAQAANYAVDCLDMELPTDIGEEASLTFSGIVADATDRTIDFSDITIPKNRSSPLQVSRPMKRIIENAVKNIAPDMRQLEKFTLSTETRRQLDCFLG